MMDTRCSSTSSPTTRLRSARTAGGARDRWSMRSCSSTSRDRQPRDRRPSARRPARARHPDSGLRWSASRPGLLERRHPQRPGDARSRLLLLSLGHRPPRPRERPADQLPHSGPHRGVRRRVRASRRPGHRHRRPTIPRRRTRAPPAPCTVAVARRRRSSIDNDGIAAGLGVTSELGVPAPEKLSLLAWDESALCQVAHTVLSALSIDVHAMGMQVADCVLNLLAGGPVTSHGAPLPRLIARGPTAPAAT